jgi:hypothetical protein
LPHERPQPSDTQLKVGLVEQLALQFHEREIRLGFDPLTQLKQDLRRHPRRPTPTTDYALHLTGALACRRDLPAPGYTHAKAQSQFSNQALAAIIGRKELPP